MSNEGPQLAIVGKNLSSAVAALHLHEHLGERLAWFQSLKDPAPTDDEQFVILNHLQRSQLKVSIVDEVLTESPRIFIGSHRHYPATAIIRFVKTQLTDCPYLRAESPAVLAKALAVGLWNDLSPHVLDASSNPRPRWIEEVPESFSHWEAGPFSLVRRDRLIQAAILKITEKRSRADFDRRRVLGIDRSFFNRGTQVIFNAPFGGESFQSVLWTTSLYTIKEEGPKKAALDLGSSNQPVAFWKTFVGEVNSDCVAFLPTMSLWIPVDSASQRFRATGLLNTSALRRVICVPSAKAGRHSLQIQSLHFYDSPRSYERPDSFLWNFCPYLRGQNLEFVDAKSEENLIFRSPFSSHVRLGTGLDFWRGGLDCGFRKVPKFQWGIESRKRNRETQPSSSQ